MKRWIVRERVVFEYTWRVHADTAEEATDWCDEHGDGEAFDQSEVEREFLSVRELKGSGMWPDPLTGRKRR